MTKLIRLTEITKDGAGTKKQPMLLNPEIIATVTTGELEKKTVHIIGEAAPDQVTFIQYRNNSGTFVAETLDEVEALLAPESEAEKAFRLGVFDPAAQK